MAKIDRLGWTDGFSFLAYGVRIGVRVNRPEALARVIERLPPGWKMSRHSVVDRIYSLRLGGAGGSARVRNFHLLYGDLRRLARTHDLDEALDLFESDLRLYVAEYARRRIFVHAGVVGWRGQAIVIPGRTMSGKTTLVAELVRAGAVYYSDEYAVFDDRGRVHPYPKPLSIRDPETFRQEDLEVAELGGAIGKKPLPVGLVLVSRYREGVRWRPRRISSGLGALALLDNTVAIRREPEKSLPLLRTAVLNATVLKGARGEVRQVAGELLERLSTTSEGEQHPKANKREPAAELSGCNLNLMIPPSVPRSPACSSPVFSFSRSFVARDFTYLLPACIVPFLLST